MIRTRTLSHYVSRYHPRAVRSLVYMLQACEYDVKDYVAWLGRTADFRRVERRKRLVMTLKARILLAAAWALLAAGLLLAIEGVRIGGVVPISVAIAIVLLVPLALSQLILLPLVLINAVQAPLEMLLVRQAAKKLRAHTAVKIAIAGSFGKTSMREILRTVLSEHKTVAAPGGSHNTPIAIARFIKRLSGDEDVLIFELGEYYPRDIEKLAAIVRPDIGIITGVNEAHLSKFKTLETAASTIFELQDFMTSRGKGDALYVNAENAPALAHASAGALGYSRRGVGDWKVVAAETSLEGTSFALERGTKRIAVQSQLLGLHHIGPLAAAAHLALSLGLSAREIETGCAKTTAFAHRLERTDDASGVITLDDSYNGNPDGAAAVIDFLASLEGHRRWYVTPGLVEMGDRAEEIHKDIGKRLAKAGIEHVVLIRNSVTLWIEEGLKEHGFAGDLVWFDDALRCYAALPAMTVSGDVVLLQNDWPDQYA